MRLLRMRPLGCERSTLKSLDIQASQPPCSWSSAGPVQNGRIWPKSWSRTRLANSLRLGRAMASHNGAGRRQSCPRNRTFFHAIEQPPVDRELRGIATGRLEHHVLSPVLTVHDAILRAGILHSNHAQHGIILTETASALKGETGRTGQTNPYANHSWQTL